MNHKNKMALVSFAAFNYHNATLEKLLRDEISESEYHTEAISQLMKSNNFETFLSLFGSSRRSRDRALIEAIHHDNRKMVIMLTKDYDFGLRHLKFALEEACDNKRYEIACFLILENSIYLKVERTEEDYD